MDRHHSSHRPPWPLFAALALLVPFGPRAAAAAGPGFDLGAHLQAGHRLHEALVGRHAAARVALPGSARGLVLRADRDHPFDEKACHRAIREYGQAYAAGDSVVVTDVQVSRREMDVCLGLGGYEERLVTDPGARMPDGRPYGLPPGLQERGGDPTTCRVYTEDEVRRYREAVREYEHQAADAREAALLQRRMTLARRTGTRIHLVFAKDVPLERLDPAAVREMLAGCLAFAE